ncbi:hypothetical protein B0J14DRAFT_604541 [Halenospora varia]|nr:hypothetical protein B0J14DRAFT_604541 [Halenospora varia]
MDSCSSRPVTFADLPTELRLKIWSYAATIPTDEHIIVRIPTRPILPYKKGPYATHHWFQCRIVAGSRPLGPLAANKESRVVTLQENPQFLQFRGSKIHFNAERNLLHFDRQAIWALTLYQTHRRYQSYTCERYHDDHFKKWRGLTDIWNISVPQCMNYHCDSMADLTTSNAKENCGRAGPFVNVQRIYGVNLPNTWTDREEHDRFIDQQVEDMLQTDTNHLSDTEWNFFASMLGMGASIYTPCFGEPVDQPGYEPDSDEDEYHYQPTWGTLNPGWRLHGDGRMNARHHLWKLHEDLERMLVRPRPDWKYPEWNEGYLVDCRGRHRQELVLWKPKIGGWRPRFVESMWIVFWQGSEYVGTGGRREDRATAMSYSRAKLEAKAKQQLKVIRQSCGI